MSRPKFGRTVVGIAAFIMLGACTDDGSCDVTTIGHVVSLEDARSSLGLDDEPLTTVDGGRCLTADRDAGVVEVCQFVDTGSLTAYKAQFEDRVFDETAGVLVSAENEDAVDDVVAIIGAELPTVGCPAGS